MPNRSYASLIYNLICATHKGLSLFCRTHCTRCGTTRHPLLATPSVSTQPPISRCGSFSSYLRLSAWHPDTLAALHCNIVIQIRNTISPSFLAACHMIMCCCCSCSCSCSCSNCHIPQLTRLPQKCVPYQTSQLTDRPPALIT